LKELVKGKKRALKEETVDSAETLETRLQSVFNSSVKISKARAKLIAGVDKKCTVVLAPLGTIFPGTCGGGDPDLSAVEACAIAAARCEACLRFNAFDDLNLDCDQADDQATNGSCL